MPAERSTGGKCMAGVAAARQRPHRFPLNFELPGQKAIVAAGTETRQTWTARIDLSVLFQ